MLDLNRVVRSVKKQRSYDKIAREVALLNQKYLINRSIKSVRNEICFWSAMDFESGILDESLERLTSTLNNSNTAVHLFLVNELEDIENWITDDDNFYYLCDFQEWCKNLGVVFPDSIKVGRYGKTREMY